MEIRQSLETNFLTCRHCQQPYRKPKVLVCLHTFCQVCLEQISEKKQAELEAKELEATKRYYAPTPKTSEYRSSYRNKWSSKFRNGGYDSTYNNSYTSTRYPLYSSRTKCIQCPVCEKETAVPTGGVSELPTDQLADRLASMVDRIPTFPVCDVCTTEPLFNENGIPSALGSGFQSQNRALNNKHLTDLEQSSSEDSDESESNACQSIRSMPNGQSHNSRQRKTTTTKTACGQRRTRPKTVVSGTIKDRGNGPRPATAACLECAKRLCSDCRETHLSMPVTANHVLLRVDQMDDLQCDRHPRELRRFFCLTCRRYICVVCTFEQSTSPDVTNHGDHEIMSIREAVNAYQSQLSRDSMQTQTHIRQIESLLNSLHVCQSEMQCLYTNIDSAAKAYSDQIAQQQNTLRATVDKLAGIPLKILSGECERLDRATNEWYEFLNDDRITSRLDLMDPLEALAEAGPMLDRVNRCLRAASEPLHADMARQPFLSHLKAAETTVVKNGDSGVVSSQSASPQSNPDVSDNPDVGRAAYWRSRLGKFESGDFKLGRIVTERERDAEAKAQASRFVTTCAQTGPELVRALPPAKGMQRHRAVQVNLFGTNLDDRSTQTDSISSGTGTMKILKVDAGTQYMSSDVNPPVTMYRSLRQMIVQK